MNDRDTRQLDSFTHECSMAVQLVDSLTEGAPVGDPTLSVTNADVEPVTNPSGYRVFVDLEDESATLALRVESDAYLVAEQSETPSTLPDDDPLVAVRLEPGPGYPFGSGETVVRGLVEDGDEPVAGAEVEYVEGAASTRTDDRGDFALPMKTLTDDGLGTDGDGNRALKPGGSDPTIRATLADDRTADRTVTVRIGETASTTFSF